MHAEPTSLQDTLAEPAADEYDGKTDGHAAGEETRVEGSESAVNGVPSESAITAGTERTATELAEVRFSGVWHAKLSYIIILLEG